MPNDPKYTYLSARYEAIGKGENMSESESVKKLNPKKSTFIFFIYVIKMIVKNKSVSTA
jgi:hypothetical protein